MLAHKTGRMLEGEYDAYVDYVHSDKYKIKKYDHGLICTIFFPSLSNLLFSLHVGLTTDLFILLSKL